PGALRQAMIFVDAPPCIARVFASEETAVSGFHQRVDAARVGPGNRNADASENSARQAAFEPFPCCARIGGFIKTAARAAAGERIGSTVRFPQGAEYGVRIRRIESQVNSPGLFILIKPLLPGFPAVIRTEDSAFHVRPVDVSERRNVNNFGI